MHSHLGFILIVPTLIACSGGSSQNSSGELAPVPPEATLCMLVPGQARVADTLQVLGAPFFRTDLADGSVTLLYEYATSESSLGIAEIQFQFPSASGALTAVGTSNLPEPACWQVTVGADGGL